MRSLVAAAMIGVLTLSACSTRLNPFNWFGGSEEQKISAAPSDFVTDARPMVAQVTQLVIERMPGGAIVRARGMPPSQGYWDVELVARNDGKPEKGELILDFRAFEPLFTRPAGTPVSRELVVATFLSDTELSGVRTITVVGANNRRSARR